MRVAIDSRRRQRSHRDAPCRFFGEFDAANEGDILDIFSAVFDHQVSGQRRSLWRQARKINIAQISAPKLLQVIMEDWWRLSTYGCAVRAS